MYRVIAYSRKTDDETCLLECKEFTDARKHIDALKRFLIIFADDTELFDDVYFYVQDENGCSVY